MRALLGGHIRPDADGIAVGGLCLCHLEPVVVADVLQERLTRIAETLQPFTYPGLFAFRSAKTFGAVGPVDHKLSHGGTGDDQVGDLGMIVAVLLVHHHHPFLVVKRDKAFVDRVDGLGQQGVRVGLVQRQPAERQQHAQQEYGGNEGETHQVPALW